MSRSVTLPRLRVLAADVLVGVLCCVVGSAWLRLLEPGRHAGHGSAVEQGGGIAGWALTQTVLPVVVVLAAVRAERRGISPLREVVGLAPATAVAVAAGAQLHAMSEG